MVQVVMRNIYVSMLNTSSYVMLDRREKKKYLNLPDKTCASYQNVVRTKLDHFSNSLPLLIFSIKQATYLLSTYYLLSTGKYGLLS